MNLKKMTRYFWTGLRLAAGGLFIAASVYKIISPDDFARQVFNYKILPGWAVNPVAAVLPWVQLLSGLALLFNRLTRGASFLLALMMAAFQGAVASALIRGLNISCGCFQSGGPEATWMTFFRDSGIFVLVLLVLWDQLWREKNKKEEILWS